MNSEGNSFWELLASFPSNGESNVLGSFHFKVFSIGVRGADYDGLEEFFVLCVGGFLFFFFFKILFIYFIRKEGREKESEKNSSV